VERLHNEQSVAGIFGFDKRRKGAFGRLHAGRSKAAKLKLTNTKKPGAGADSPRDEADAIGATRVIGVVVPIAVSRDDALENR
jgi:hypothetical protein